MNTGMVSDVERFATRDGPGIRTVVFMKGCNMRCGWCHNPEGLGFGAELLYDKKRCIGCGMCASVCPTGAHAVANGLHELDRSLCKACLRCVNMCCTGALQSAGRTYTVEELFSLLLEDAPYYRHSGGGVTISGGEPLCQAAFVGVLLKRLCQEGIHTALETNLSLGWEKLEPLLADTRLLMFDLKHMDEEKHLHHTGVPLETVLSNAKRVAHKKIPVIVRTPVIAGVNDDEKTIRAIAGFLKQHLDGSLLYYELLTYHPMGTDKAAKLGSWERSRPMQAAPRERMHALACAAAECGIPVRIDAAVWNGSQEGKA